MSTYTLLFIFILKISTNVPAALANMEAHALTEYTVTRAVVLVDTRARLVELVSFSLWHSEGLPDIYIMSCEYFTNDLL